MFRTTRPQGQRQRAGNIESKGMKYVKRLQSIYSWPKANYWVWAARQFTAHCHPDRWQISTFMQDHTLTTSKYMELLRAQRLIPSKAAGFTHRLDMYARWTDFPNTLNAIVVTIRPWSRLPAQGSHRSWFRSRLQLYGLTRLQRKWESVSRLPKWMYRVPWFASQTRTVSRLKTSPLWPSRPLKPVEEA